MSSILVVRRAIEAWILGDYEALSRELGIHVCVGDPEGVEDPAKILDEYMMRSGGRRYVKSYEAAKNIAGIIDPVKASQRVKSLREFIEALMDF